MKRYNVAMQCIYTQCIDVFPSFQIMNDYSDTYFKHRFIFRHRFGKT